MLKKQIKVRTVADWNDVIPGFLEGDLVAHCGDKVGGSFLNTLVLTDIASPCTEFFLLLRKSEADVINALRVAQKVLPSKLQAVEVTSLVNPELVIQNINPEITLYRKTKKTRNELKSRAWRTRKDPFEQEWNIIKRNLSLNPELTAKDLLKNLTKANGERFNMSHLRTMQRRIANWRTQQIKINQEKILNKNSFTQDDAIKNYVKLVAHSIVSGLDLI